MTKTAIIRLLNSKGVNLKYLFKIQIGGSSSKHGKYSIQFFFDKRDPEEILKVIKDGNLNNLKRSYPMDIVDIQYFPDITKQELEEVTKILLEINPNLKIEKWKLFG